MNTKEHYQSEQKEPTLFEVPSEWQKEWQDMPEFVQGKLTEYAKIIIRFRNQKDLDEFCAAIGQKLNRHSQCTWYPELPSKPPKKFRYVDGT